MILNATRTMDASNHQGDIRSNINDSPVNNNEGVDLDQQIFQPDPMPLLPTGIQRVLYESIWNYVWNNEFVGYNVGRLLVEGGSGTNEGDSRSNNNEGVDFDRDNLWISNYDGSEAREVYLWSDCFRSSIINQNHNNVWLVTALVCDDTDSETASLT